MLEPPHCLQVYFTRSCGQIRALVAVATSAFDWLEGTTIAVPTVAGTIVAVVPAADVTAATVAGSVDEAVTVGPLAAAVASVTATAGAMTT